MLPSSTIVVGPLMRTSGCFVYYGFATPLHSHCTMSAREQPGFACPEHHLAMTKHVASVERQSAQFLQKRYSRSLPPSTMRCPFDSLLPPFKSCTSTYSRLGLCLAHIFRSFLHEYSFASFQLIHNIISYQATQAVLFEYFFALQIGVRC